MTSRDTYNASVVVAINARVVTNIANAIAHQETINVSTINAGNNPARGSSAAMVTAVQNANAAYAAARLNAEMAKQVAIQVAKDTLRATGDLHPA